MLGAIESLLCAVVLDGMTGEKHSANSELLGQGIGNIIAPYFGGITATAAIARSSLNVKLGAESPISAAIHAIVVLIGLLFLTPVIAYLPMSAMAALLIVVAWNMSEAPKAIHLLKKAPHNDIWVYAVCISLTVIFDMVLAITSGILLASVLFVKEIAAMTMVADISDNKKLLPSLPAAGWSVFKINGPLFFAAADRVFGELSLICGTKKGIILTLEAVPILDAGGLSALNKLITKCINTNTKLYITDIPYQPLKTLARADCKPIDGVMEYFPDLIDALKNTWM
jgi:SulP family sulfate permease